MKKLLMSFIKNEKGATAVEYAMIVGLIALVSFSAFTRLGAEVQRIIGAMYIKLFDVHG